MPDLKSELLAKVVSPPSPAAKTQSVLDYIVESLMAKPGMTGQQLKHGQPAAFAPNSVAPRLSDLVRWRAVERRKVKRAGRGGHMTFAYWLKNDGLDHIPEGRLGVPHRPHKTSNRGRNTHGPSTLPGDTPGAPEIEPMVEPYNPDNPPAAVSSTFVADRPAPPAPPTDTTPRLVIWTSGKQRTFTIAEARTVYDQLKLVFDPQAG